MARPRGLAVSPRHALEHVLARSGPNPDAVFQYRMRWRFVQTLVQEQLH